MSVSGPTDAYAHYVTSYAIVYPVTQFLRGSPFYSRIIIVTYVISVLIPKLITLESIANIERNCTQCVCHISPLQMLKTGFVPRSVGGGGRWRYRVVGGWGLA
jgi:hypothetical protein